MPHASRGCPRLIGASTCALYTVERSRRRSLPIMQSTQWKRLGVFAFFDTGPPHHHQKDYVTLVMVHGRGGTADFFVRFLPLAGKLGVRVVALNRRDYPGSAPFSEEDRALLLSTTHDTPAASENADHLHENAPSQVMGYPFPDGYYFPMNDPSISPEKAIKIFPLWITGYYAHGDSLETLSLRDALDEPSPTITRMSREDLASTFHEPPTLLDGSDMMIKKGGVDRGAFSRLREAALFAPQNAEIAWPNVEFRYVWCDRSVWLMPWGIWSFRAEIEQARKDGRRIRKHSIVRMRGANHCAHWDEPERTLRLLLSDAPSDIDIRGVAKL
ncbi:alpha/beta-hydrolase [Lactarius deliciosus]|nr:alpha/beta-hydrolase [Lactarius deliciosus]